nr:hypothetical protein [Tanacetum cinerariifolium]
NKVLVTKPHNKTLCELLHGRIPSIGFMRPFGCPMTILNTLESLGKFEENIDEGFLVGYSVNSKAFRVFNSRTRIIQETLHANFLENRPNVSGSSPTWKQDDKTKKEAKGKSPIESITRYRDLNVEFEDCSDNSSNKVNAVGSIVLTVGQNSLNGTNTFSVVGPSNAAAEAVNTACYVQNKVLVTKPHNKTLYELLRGRIPSIGFMRPFGCPITILNTLDSLGNFEENIDEGFLVGYSVNSKAFRVFNSRTRIIQETLHANFLENRPNVSGSGPTWLFDIDSLTRTMNYQPVNAGNHTNPSADVKSAFLYRNIEEEVYVCQPPGFEDPNHPDKVYKVVKALYGLHQVPRACQDKYVAEILRKFGLTEGKSASTPIDTEKPLLKDPNGEDVDVHTYKSMIGSLMYLTSSRPDIMFTVCACAHFQVTPKVSHLHAVKRIFRYLKGKPNLGLWYPKDSPFDLVAYSDSDYAGASLDRKYTTGECQFLGCRLISWQCKKQTVVAISSTEAEYVAAASCCAQVLWI